MLKASSIQEIHQTFESLDRIDSGFGWKDEKITKHDIMENPDVNNFYDKHVKVAQYAFQIKKCLDPNCKHHNPIQMDTDTFKKIKWLPMPTSAEGDEKYKTLDVAYSDTQVEVTDKHRPGKNNDTRNESSEKPEKPPPDFYMGINSARHALFCEECGKPRVLYSKKVLTDDERNFLLREEEDIRPVELNIGYGAIDSYQYIAILK